MKTYKFKAATAQGLGGIPFYEEVVRIQDNKWALRNALVKFAIKYGVELQMIEVIEI